MTGTWSCVARLALDGRKGQLPALVLGLAMLTASGCATRGFVRSQIETANAGVTSNMSAMESRMSARDDQNAALAGRALEHADGAQAGVDGARQLALGWTQVSEVGRYRAHFGFDRADLDEEARAALDPVSTALADNPNYVAAIFGYADPTGDENYNAQLAERRASAVKRFLLERAPVDAVRMSSVAFGENPPESEVADLGEGAARRQVVVVLFERKPAEKPQSLSAR